MDFTTKKLNKFLLFKIPSAYFTGVRVKKIEANKAVVRVTHKWINQNPFNSLYYGVQAMAAELSTGVLVMKKIKESNQNIAMLVVKQSAEFTKKGTGVVQFTCTDGALIDKAIEKAIQSGKGQTFVLQSTARNEQGDQVSIFEFEWSIKLRSQ